MRGSTLALEHSKTVQTIRGCAFTRLCVPLEHVCCLLMHECYVDRYAYDRLYTRTACEREHVCVHAFTAAQGLPATGWVSDRLTVALVCLGV